jgi:hypothetical protein
MLNKVVLKKVRHTDVDMLFNSMDKFCTLRFARIEYKLLQANLIEIRSKLRVMLAHEKAQYTISLSPAYAIALLWAYKENYLVTPGPYETATLSIMAGEIDKQTQ